MIIPTKTQAEFIDEVTRLIQSGYTWLNGDTQIFSSLWEVYDEDTAITTNDELKVFGYVDNTNAEQAAETMASLQP